VPLVAAGGGEAALGNSWLWLKLVAPVDASGTLMPNASWGTAQTNCNQLAPAMQPFGTRMPMSNTDLLLGETRLAAIRDWICAGAPGP
jgi:hypothetical protein